MNDWPAGLTLRPIQAWPGTMTPDRDRRRSNFSAPWRSTLDTLDRELWHLNAQTRVLQVAMREQDFRIDGMPRANAKAEHPGIILSFHAPDVGDLSYPCDTFTTWQDNLRAIVLALEALRKVDRYGVTRRGEQYRGWKAIESIAMPAAMTSEQALAIIANFSGQMPNTWTSVSSAVRLAQRLTHPDTGGRREDFEQVQKAIDVLRREGRL